MSREVACHEPFIRKPPFPGPHNVRRRLSRTIYFVLYLPTYKSASGVFPVAIAIKRANKCMGVPVRITWGRGWNAFNRTSAYAYQRWSPCNSCAIILFSWQHIKTILPLVLCHITGLAIYYYYSDIFTQFSSYVLRIQNGK